MECFVKQYMKVFEFVCCVECTVSFSVERIFTGFWFLSPEGKDHWKDLGVSAG